MPDLSERLRILRKEKGLTQQEVGDTLGKSLRAYQYYESGTRRPEYPQLLALADFFDVSLDYLTGRSETGSGCRRTCAGGRPQGSPLQKYKSLSGERRRGRSQTGPPVNGLRSELRRRGHTPGWLLSAFGRFTFSPRPTVFF